MPKDVSVSTAEPGSSAKTAAYRAPHRELSCGPSRRGITTIIGPTARMTLATSSDWARSSHTSEASVTPLPRSTNWTDRRGTSIASHQRMCGCNAPPRWYWLIWASSSDQRWCLVWRMCAHCSPEDTPMCTQLRGNRPGCAGRSRTPVISPVTPCRARSASRSSISPCSTAFSGRTTTSTVSASSLAATSIRSTRSRSSRSDGTNSKKPKGSSASFCSGPATGRKSELRTRSGHGRSR
jgi:hypothetical protein